LYYWANKNDDDDDDDAERVGVAVAGHVTRVRAGALVVARLVGGLLTVNHLTLTRCCCYCWPVRACVRAGLADSTTHCYCLPADLDRLPQCHACPCLTRVSFIQPSIVMAASVCLSVFTQGVLSHLQS